MDKERSNATFGGVRGFTLLEIVLAVAVLAILMGIAAPAFRTPSARVYANDVQALVQQARYEAVKRNRPVAVMFDVANQAVELRVAAGTSVVESCLGASVLKQKAVDDYPNVSFTTTVPTTGFAWLPSGRPVNCAGSPNVAGTIDIAGNGGPVTLVVSVGGRIEEQ